MKTIGVYVYIFVASAWMASPGNTIDIGWDNLGKIVVINAAFLFAADLARKKS